VIGQGIVIVWRWDDIYGYFHHLVDCLIAEDQDPALLMCYIGEYTELVMYTYSENQELVEVNEPNTLNIAYEVFGDQDTSFYRNCIIDTRNFIQAHYRLLTDIGQTFLKENRRLGYIESDWCFDKGSDGGDAFLVFYPVDTTTDSPSH